MLKIDHDDVRVAPAVPPTVDDVRKNYAPARTLGAPAEVQLALDSQLETSGVYSLIQHSLELGQGFAPQFMGYGALQSLSQNGLIRACVETVADDITREWVELTGADDDDEGGSDRREKLTHAMERYKLREVFHHACELVGYEGGALIFIDTGATGDELAEPLNLTSYSRELRGNGVKRFTLVDPVNVFPGSYNSLYPLEPDYYVPTFWWVLGQRVHASRLVRLVANECPILLKPAYNFFGIPQAQILYDYVLHFQDCRTAAARLLKKFSMTVFKTDMQNTLFQAGGTAEIDSRIRFLTSYMTNDGVLAIDKEAEDVVKLETPLSGVTDIVRQALEFLAALNRTPAVKLLGVSPSGFNATGESDIRNYYDHVLSQANKVVRPGLTKCLRVLQIATMGDVDPSISFDFKPLGQEDQASLAMTQKTKVETLATALNSNIINEDEARAALANDKDSGFNIDAEMPEDLKEKIQGGAAEGGAPGEQGGIADLLKPTGPEDDETDEALREDNPTNQA